MTTVFRRDREGVKDLIKKLREEKNYTLHEIGNFVGKAESVVWRWENGVIPRGKTFEKLLQLIESQETLEHEKTEGGNIGGRGDTNVGEILKAIGRIEYRLDLIEDFIGMKSKLKKKYVKPVTG